MQSKELSQETPTQSSTTRHSVEESFEFKSLKNYRKGDVSNSSIEKKTKRTKRLRDGGFKLSSNVPLDSSTRRFVSGDSTSVKSTSFEDENSHHTTEYPHELKYQLDFSHKTAIKNSRLSRGQWRNSNGHQSKSEGSEVNRTKLPILSKKSEICNSLLHNDILLIKGDTGSGKSTQVPQFLSSQPWCKRWKVTIKDSEDIMSSCYVGGVVAVTQPRRVAAITLAHRVNLELSSSLQSKPRSTSLVGYSVRFDKFLPQGMKIKFVTEGTLLQEMLQDPSLKQYSAIVVDEIHERSVDVDLIVGFLKGIVYGNKDFRGGVPLKIVIMSATLDLKVIEKFFISSGIHEGISLEPKDSRVLSALNSPEKSITLASKTCDSDEKFKDGKIEIVQPSSPEPFIDVIDKKDVDQSQDLENFRRKKGLSMIIVEGRQYKVEIVYEKKPVSDYMIRMLEVIMRLHIEEPLPGDILAFLTGQEEIETLHAELESYSQQLVKSLPRMTIIPLHGSLSAQAQQEAFKRTREKFTRKIVLATNIAETSVTVPGIRYVVDCGKSKIKQYRPKLGLESLLVKPVSKVSAIQRAGRAGREAEGKCYRLYTEADYNKLDENEVPEILRCDVVEAILKMKARGIEDVLAFPLMDTPNILAMEKALIRLHLMSALDNNGRITDMGKKIARLPLPVSYASVLTAVENKDSYIILSIIDIISCLTTDSEVFLQPKQEEDRENMEQYRKDIHHREGDIITLLQTMQGYASEETDRNEWCQKRMISIRAMKMAMQIRKQLRQICLSMKLLKERPPPDPQPIRPISPEHVQIILKLILKAFATNTALMAPNGGYITTEGKHNIVIHPSSVLYGQKLEAIMFLEHIFTAKSYARRVSAIEAPWIVEVLVM